MKLWQKEEENVRGDEVAESLGGALQYYSQERNQVKTKKKESEAKR